MNAAEIVTHPNRSIADIFRFQHLMIWSRTMRTAGRSLLFTDLVKFKGEPGLNAAVVEAARRNRTSTPEYLRRVVRERLAAEGVALPALDGGDGPRTPPAAPAMRQAA